MDNKEGWVFRVLKEGKASKVFRVLRE